MTCAPNSRTATPTLTRNSTRISPSRLCCRCTTKPRKGWSYTNSGGPDLAAFGFVQHWVGGRVALECMAIPFRQIRRHLITGLQEFEDCIVRGTRRAGVVILQQELTEFRVEVTGSRSNRCLVQTCGRRRGVTIERRRAETTVARPKSGADHFVRVRFAGNQVRASARRRGTPGKSRYRQIETSPEKMDRADFAQERRREFLEQTVGSRKNPPEPVCVA